MGAGDAVFMIQLLFFRFVNLDQRGNIRAKFEHSPIHVRRHDDPAGKWVFILQCSHHQMSFGGEPDIGSGDQGCDPVSNVFLKHFV